MAKARPLPMDGLYFATRPIHSHNHPGAPVIPKPYYNYGYSVQDEYSGNNYNAQETADGKYQSTNVIEAYLNKATPTHSQIFSPTLLVPPALKLGKNLETLLHKNLRPPFQIH